MKSALISVWWWSSGVIICLLIFISNALHSLQLVIWKARYSVANYIIDFGKPKEEEVSE